MLKKTLFILLMGVLLLSACTAGNTNETPMDAEPTATEETGPEPDPGSVFEGERMPCTTVFGYETNEETDSYQDVVDQLPPVTDEDWVKGNPDAPITVVEYADFQCPACAPFASYLEALLDFFPDSFRIVFRHLPLPSIHDKAYITAMAAEAAGAQGMFWEMYVRLYEDQQVWYYLTEEEFIDWVKIEAENFGLDVDQFEVDLLDEEIRAQLETETEELLAMGVHYTPFVYINGRIFRQGNPNLLSMIGINEFDGYEECPPWVIDTTKSYSAVLDTSAGEILIDLFPDSAPLAVNSFVFLAREGWFDDIYFHRVVEGFVAQAGDPSGLGAIGPGYTFANEVDANLSFDSIGVLGMANAGVDTNGSQFFITLAPATNLDGGYTIFGKVQDESLPVLSEIALRDPDTAVGFENATIINSIEIVEN